jgi:hypothetical protein
MILFFVGFRKPFASSPPAHRPAVPSSVLVAPRVTPAIDATPADRQSGRTKLRNVLVAPGPMAWMMVDTAAFFPPRPRSGACSKSGTGPPPGLAVDDTRDQCHESRSMPSCLA